MDFTRSTQYEIREFLKEMSDENFDSFLGDVFARTQTVKKICWDDINCEPTKHKKIFSILGYYGKNCWDELSCAMNSTIEKTIIIILVGMII